MIGSDSEESKAEPSLARKPIFLPFDVLIDRVRLLVGSERFLAFLRSQILPTGDSETANPFPSEKARLGDADFWKRAIDEALVKRAAEGDSGDNFLFSSLE